MHRRRFLHLTSLSAASLYLPSLLAQDKNTITLTIGAHPIAQVPPRFTGLSYESRQLGDPSFFSADNHPLIAAFRQLGPGVLRIGGNTSEYCFFRPDAQPPAEKISADPDKGRTAPPETTITPLAIRNLRAFLDACDWQCIYGLNLGKGTPDNSAAEAAFVAATLGSRLDYLQIGNEPDLFHQNGLRPTNWSFDDFAREWEQHFTAVRKRLPHARFAGPADAFNIDWTRQFASRFHQHIELLTHHYYAEGPPTDPSMNIDRLLVIAPQRQAKLFADLSAIAREHKLPWRLAETNSCYSGGKEGVSNTFASALWGSDMMFQLAESGAIGINFHGGGHGWYTPIAGSSEERPLYAAMQALPLSSATSFLPVLGLPGDRSFSAYTFRSQPGSKGILLINKSASETKYLHVDRVRWSAIQRLTLHESSLDTTRTPTWERDVLAMHTEMSPTLALPPATLQLLTFPQRP